MLNKLENPALHLETRATSQATRSTLSHLQAFLSERGYNEAQLNAVLLATGEALNNICEHAYCEPQTGPIFLELYFNDRLLRIDLTDQGHEFPDNNLPGEHLPEFGNTIEELPEGGFGWFIIRSLTFKVRYYRQKNTNRLSLVFKICATS